MLKKIKKTRSMTKTGNIFLPVNLLYRFIPTSSLVIPIPFLLALLNLIYTASFLSISILFLHLLTFFYISPDWKTGKLFPSRTCSSHYNYPPTRTYNPHLYFLKPKTNNEKPFLILTIVPRTYTLNAVR